MKKLSEKQLHNIKQKIYIKDNYYIVRVNVMSDKDISEEECNRNVYCINSNSQIYWQIDSQPTGFSEDPFVNINFENNILLARNFSGFEYIVDLENGKTKRIGWSK